MALTVRRFDSLQAVQELAPEWNALFARAATGLPFHSYAWSVTWCHHLLEDRAGVRDQVRVRAVYEDGVLLAVAPLVLTERPRGGPVRVRFLQYIGADPNMTELRTMLCLPGRERDAHRALWEALHAEGGWDWIRWSGLRKDLATTPERHLAHDLAPVPNFLLKLAPSWDEFRAGLGRNIKESLRKCYNSLKRDGKELELRVARSTAEVSDALDRFFALHSARAQADVAVRHNDVFSSLQCRAFLQDVCREFAAQDVARVFELVVDGKVVATRLAFEFPTSVYLYYSGYDPEYAKYSVMTTCVAEAIRYAISRGHTTVNLSTGRDVSKTRWDPQELLYAEGIELASNPRAQLAYKATELAYETAAQPALREIVQRFFGRRA